MARRKVSGGTGIAADAWARLVSGSLDQAQREAQLDRLAALYAERTDVRHPFATSGRPLRTRADLRRPSVAIAHIPVR